MHIVGDDSEISIQHKFIIVFISKAFNVRIGLPCLFKWEKLHAGYASIVFILHGGSQKTDFVVLHSPLLEKTGGDLTNPSDLEWGDRFGWCTEPCGGPGFDLHEDDSAFVRHDQVDFAETAEAVFPGQQTATSPDEFLRDGRLGGVTQNTIRRRVALPIQDFS